MKWIIVLLTIAGQTFGDCVTDGTNLISTILIHRHGDRTPVASTAALSTDLEAVKAATAPYGYGQLTDIGKRRAYNLGKSIRARYNELLSPRYNKSEIYIRSTDSTRTKMTVLTAMAAVYPSYPGSWSDVINWVPTPYTTVPTKYDFNEFSLSCPKFISAYTILFLSDPPSMDKYFHVLNTVSAVSGYNITSFPVMAYNFYDVYVSQRNLGVPLSDEIAAIMPELEKAAGEAIDVLLGDKKYLALEAGVMLNEFFTQAENLIAGIDTPRVRIYSAHDLNVYAFEAAAQVTPRQGVPPYTAYFALELRQVKQTGEYVVLAVYQKDPGADLLCLPIAGCDSLLCPYDTYKKIVHAYTLDEDTWRTDCGFTDDLVVDDSDSAKHFAPRGFFFPKFYFNLVV